MKRPTSPARPRGPLPLILLLAASSACVIITDDVATDTQAASSTTTTTSSSSSASSTTEASTSASSTASSATDSATATSAPTSSTSTGESTGGLECTCSDAEYCDYPHNLCGARNALGACVARPAACDSLYAPVCGCDGQVHGNECDAASAGVDVNADGGCAPPEGYFTCGFRFCDLALAYCRVGISDTDDPDTFECVPLPGGCDPATCECVAGELCGELCELDAGGGITVTCPGG